MICTIDLLNEENNSISNFSKEMIYYDKGNFFYIHLPLYKHELCYKIKFWLKDNNILLLFHLKVLDSNKFIVQQVKTTNDYKYKVSLYKKSNKLKHTLKIEKYV